MELAGFWSGIGEGVGRVITKNLAFINISAFFLGCILGRLSEKFIFVKDLKFEKHLLTLKFILL